MKILKRGALSGSLQHEARFRLDSAVEYLLQRLGDVSPQAIEQRLQEWADRLTQQFGSQLGGFQLQLAGAGGSSTPLGQEYLAMTSIGVSPGYGSTGYRPSIPIIAIDNNKGGVGKSRTTFELATGLAAKGKRVLVLDKDSNRTQTDMSLGIQTKTFAQYDAHKDGLRDILDVLSLPAQGWARAITTYAFDPSRPNLVIHIVPGARMLETAPTRFLDAPVMQGEDTPKTFRQVLPYLLRLPEIQDAFDVVFLDVGPGQNEVMEGSILASTHVLTPIESSKPSVNGLWNFGSRVVMANKSRSASDIQYQTEMLGVCVERLNRNSGHQRKCLAEIRQVLGESGIYCFKAEVPQSDDAVGEAFDAGRPVWSMFPQDPAGNAFNLLISEVQTLLPVLN